MNKNQKYFEELKQKYTLEEIADAVMLPSELPKEEATKARNEFVAMRMDMHRNRTKAQILLGKLIRLKYQIKKETEDNVYSKDKSLATFLKQYLEIRDQSHKKLAHDIDINASKLCKIISGKEPFGKEISFRLEAHSGEIIPAIYWWRLAKKEEEQSLLNATKEREFEHAKVKNKIYSSSSIGSNLNK